MSNDQQQLAVELGSSSHRGRVREHNEDSLVAEVPQDDRNPYGLEAVIAVADGIGGHLAGEVASQLAADTVIEVLTPREGTKPPWFWIGSAPQAGLKKAVTLANRRVHDRSEEDPGERRMGTTLTIVALCQGRYALAHVGDSRAYMVTADAIEQLTQDHTWVAEQVKNGVLTEEEAARSPFRSQIVRSIGVTSRVDPDFASGELPAGAAVLVCSDGLSNMVADDDIAAAIREGPDLQAACSRLVELANGNGGHDNITVVAARYVPAEAAEEAPPAVEAEAPPEEPAAPDGEEGET